MHGALPATRIGSSRWRRASWSSKLPARCVASLVRDGDRLAEMGDRLLESGTAERRSPALPHHSMARSSRPAFGEMMGDCFRLGRRALGLSHQDFGGATVQRLAPTFEQAVVGCVLNQRVLEAIVGLDDPRPRQ